MIHQTNEEQVYEAMLNLLSLLRRMKPNDRSDLDRSYAVMATDVQKIVGFWFVWVMYMKSAPVWAMDNLLDDAQEAAK